MVQVEGAASPAGCHHQPEWHVRDTNTPMIANWNTLPETLQLYLAQQAFHQAAETIAGQAETLAREFEDGTLADRGGAEALRLMAAVVRAIGPGNTSPPALAS